MNPPPPGVIKRKEIFPPIQKYKDFVTVLTFSYELLLLNPMSVNDKKEKGKIETFFIGQTFLRLSCRVTYWNMVNKI